MANTLASGGPPFTVTTVTPTDTASMSTSRNGSANYGSHRSSIRFGRHSSINTDTIPRRHSGAASMRRATGGGNTPAPLQQRLSQPQAKTSTCSLMMVSPNAVSRSPSQQVITLFLASILRYLIKSRPSVALSTVFFINRPQIRHRFLFNEIFTLP